MFHSTVAADAVTYQVEPGPGIEGQALGSTARAGLASFLGFVQQDGVGRALAAAVHLPVQERRNGFTHVQKSLALLAALAAGCRSARDSDFTLAPDPTAVAVLGVPRWPPSSQLTRHLHAFRPQHVHALRRATEDLVATHSAARRRLRRGARVGGRLDP